MKMLNKNIEAEKVIQTCSNMKIKGAVVDFGTSRALNILVKGVESFCKIEDNANAPDFVLYSCFGAAHLKYKKAVKIFMCDENVYPDFNQCDYAIGSVRLDCERYLWFPPCFSTYLNRELPQLPQLDKSMARRKFCSFIYSQCGIGEGSIMRKNFCEELMRLYKHVDCPGRILHNMDAPELAIRENAAQWNASKIEFLSKYKFIVIP